MALISDRINNQLNQLIGKCFEMNRMLDRGVSLLKIRWKLPRTSDIVHSEMAHAYIGELFADSVGEYQALRNNETIYPETPVGDKNYDNVLDFFYEYHLKNIELSNFIKDIIDDAVEVGDMETKIFLDGVLKTLTKFTATSQDLVDIFEVCNNDYFKMHMIDVDIKKYINL